jgi:hypothetical protein
LARILHAELVDGDDHVPARIGHIHPIEASSRDRAPHNLLQSHVLEGELGAAGVKA